MRKAQRTALELYQQQKQIERDYEAACKKAFPVGSWVDYEHGSHVRTVRVLSHGHGHMRVVGVSGREYDLAYYFPMMLLEKL